MYSHPNDHTEFITAAKWEVQTLRRKYIRGLFNQQQQGKLPYQFWNLFLHNKCCCSRITTLYTQKLFFVSAYLSECSVSSYTTFTDAVLPVWYIQRIRSFYNVRLEDEGHSVSWVSEFLLVVSCVAPPLWNVVWPRGMIFDLSDGGVYIFVWYQVWCCLPSGSGTKTTSLYKVGSTLSSQTSIWLWTSPGDT